METFNSKGLFLASDEQRSVSLFFLAEITPCRLTAMCGKSASPERRPLLQQLLVVMLVIGIKTIEEQSVGRAGSGRDTCLFQRDVVLEERGFRHQTPIVIPIGCC